MRNLIIVFILMISWLPVNAQKDILDFSYAKYAIGITPSALVNAYVGLQLSQDFRLNSTNNFALETAYLFASSFKRPTQGYRVRAGIQHLYYTDRDFGLQIGFSGLYRFTNESFFQEEIRPEGYIEKISISKTKKMIGGLLSTGIITPLSDRIMLEGGFGLGYGKVIIEDSVEDDSIDITEDIFNDFSNLFVRDIAGDWPVVIAYFHLNFSYKIF